MHRALLLSEILRNIFAHIVVYKRQQCLSILARTCKAFYEPAMDLLWHHIDGIKPLLGCVTRLHPLMRKYESSGMEIEPLYEHETCQFLRHADRVRSLSLSSNHHRLFRLINSQTCVFPRLLSLQWRFDEFHMPDPIHLQLFLSPTLRHCTLPLFHPSLRSIGTCCQGLEELSVFEPEIEPFDVSDVIRSCNRLVNLTSPLLNSAAFVHLSNLPTFARLKIYARIPYASRPDWAKLELGPFLNLRALILEVADITTITTFTRIIQHSEFPSLNELEISDNDLPWADVEQLFRALSQCKARRTLQNIKIISCTDSGDSSMTVTQLRQLWLQCPFNIDDDTLLDAMSCWPHARSLVYLNKSRSLNLPNVTPRGLFTALRVCPDLHTMRIEVDAANVDIDPRTESFQHTSLKRLNLGLSIIGDAKTFARIMIYTFPSLRQVMGGQLQFSCGFMINWLEVFRRIFWPDQDKPLYELENWCASFSGVAEPYDVRFEPLFGRFGRPNVPPNVRLLMENY